MRKTILVVVSLLALSLVGCGGKTSPTSTTPPPSVKPLDPQGNWLFTLTGTQQTLVFAGQLYELTSPVVTSNPMGAVGESEETGCNTAFVVTGQASGTNVINLTAAQNQSTQPVSFALVGTIADSQAAMSGTWTNATTAPCMFGEASGTWAAQLLVPVTGTWSGTLTAPGATISVAAVLTEDTSQTDTTMGQVTGTLAIGGSTCFSASSPLNLPAWTSTGVSQSYHAGESMIINTAPDANGQAVLASGTVDPLSTTMVFVYGFTVHGGPCDGQSFAGSLTMQ